MLIFPLSFLLITCSAISLLENKLFKTVIMPGSLICWPVVIATSLMFQFGPSLGFYEIKADEIWKLVIAAITIFFGECLGAQIKSAFHSKGRNVIQLFNEDQIELIKAVQAIVFVCLVAGILRLLLLFRSVGLNNYIATDGLDGSFLRGVIGNTVLIGYSIAPLLLLDFVKNKTKRSLVLWILFACMLFFSFVKYQSILFITSGVVFVLVDDFSRIKVMIPILVVSALSVFALSYIVMFSSRGNVATTEYIIKHALNYIGGGMLYTSVAGTMLNPLEFDPIRVFLSCVAPFLNWMLLPFGATLAGNPDTVMALLGSNGETGNVVNLLSMFYVTGDILFGSLLLMVLSLLLTLLIYATDNMFIIAAVGGAILLSFFGNTLSLLAVWKVVLFSAFIPCVARLYTRSLRKGQLNE